MSFPKPGCGGDPFRVSVSPRFHGRPGKSMLVHWIIISNSLLDIDWTSILGSFAGSPSDISLKKYYIKKPSSQVSESTFLLSSWRLIPLFQLPHPPSHRPLLPMVSRLLPKPEAPRADPLSFGWNHHPFHVTVLWPELLGLFRGETIAPWNCAPRLLCHGQKMSERVMSLTSFSLSPFFLELC